MVLLCDEQMSSMPFFLLLLFLLFSFLELWWLTLLFKEVRVHVVGGVGTLWELATCQELDFPLLRSLTTSKSG